MSFSNMYERQDQYFIWEDKSDKRD